MFTFKTITIKLTFKKAASVAIMFFCVALLTGSNFILYPSYDIALSSALSNSSNETEPPAPIDEKSPETASSSIIEEFLHEKHFHIDISLFNKQFLHKIHQAEKLKVIHYEILYPPPEFS